MKSYKDITIGFVVGVAAVCFFAWSGTLDARWLFGTVASLLSLLIIAVHCDE